MICIVTKAFRKNPVWFLILLFLAAAIAFPLISTWKGYPPYRDIHLGTAIEYAKSSISLENTRIVGFNATGTPTIQEFPIWQMLVALAFKAFGPWWGWANVVSMLIFTTALFPLYQLGKLLMGPRGGAWTLVFFLCQPLVFRYYGLASTDGAAISAAIWFCYLGYQLLSLPKSPFRWWLGAFAAGTMAALLKLPFFMAVGIGLFFFQLMTHPKALKPMVALASVGICVAIVFLAWTAYTGHLQADALFPFVDLRLSNSEMKFWFFGDWAYRLNPANWIKGGWRIMNTLFGSFVLVGLAAIGIWKNSPLRLPVCLLLGCGVTTLIFSHLVLHHSHYYLMFSPAVALLSANALMWLIESLRMNSRADWVFTGLTAILMGLSLIQGLMGMKISATFDPYYQKIATIVAEHTTPTDKILIQGGGWGGNILIRSDRSGLSIWDTKFLEEEANLKALKNLGYNKLVMISESPLLHAVQVINPGQSGQPRDLYQGHRTAIVEPWPVLHQDQDIIIQNIP
jgi:hypothetical protein